MTDLEPQPQPAGGVKPTHGDRGRAIAQIKICPAEPDQTADTDPLGEVDRDVRADVKADSGAVVLPRRSPA